MNHSVRVDHLTTQLLTLASLLILALTASADGLGSARQFTLECKGTSTLTQHGSRPYRAERKVSTLYTLEVRGDGGRYYDWEMQEWFDIDEVRDEMYILGSHDLVNVHHYLLWINRVTGEWSEDSELGDSRMLGWSNESRRGSCNVVRSRMPPRPKF